MRGPFHLALFFVCLNLSVYLIYQTQPVPSEIPPYQTPEAIETKFYPSLNFKVGDVIILGVAGLLGLLTKQYIYAGMAALMLFALDKLFPIFTWIFFGFPEFLKMLGVPEVIYVVLSALFTVIWFWFFMEILSGRFLRH